MESSLAENLPFLALALRSLTVSAKCPDRWYMQWLVLPLILASSLAGAQTLLDAPLPQPSPKYPHAMFVLESSVLAMAIVENGRANMRERYASNGEELPRRSVGKYAAIHVPIGLAATFAAWKLENSHRKSLRVLGHVIMWSAVGYHAVGYFQTADMH